MTGLRTYAVFAVVTLVVALGAFVRYRNHSFRDREEARALAAAEAVAHGEPTLAHVTLAGQVSPRQVSARYPFLGARRLGDRRLGGLAPGPDDKLLYDAANRVDQAGSFAELLDDGRVIAAVPIGRATSPTVAAPVAVAITHPPAGPDPLPWLVVVGLLVMGALCAAAGSLVGGAAEPLGVTLGASGLAVPSYLWSGPVPAGLVLGLALIAGLACHRGWLARTLAAARRDRIAYGFLAPTAIAMLVLVAAPFVIGLAIGFFDHRHGTWSFVGLANFGHILSGGGHSLNDPLNFWFTLGVTVAWTAVNVVLHVTLGVLLALALRQKWLRGRGIYRVLLILPWAIPNYITALIWSGMFQSEYGAVNGILGGLGLDKVAWFSHWSTAFTANVCTNTWLGFPFMMVVALGALESIPRDMYEAAEVDGATAWQRFWHITMPHLRPALAPAVVLGAIWTFNMFNVIYLVSNGAPGGSTDILVTQAYRWAFERGERYGLAAAYATLIFLILLLWTVFGTRVTRRKS